jgi:hypothetical protein
VIFPEEKHILVIGSGISNKALQQYIQKRRFQSSHDTEGEANTINPDLQNNIFAIFRGISIDWRLLNK